jgi:hypothetical protein
MRLFFQVSLFSVFGLSEEPHFLRASNELLLISRWTLLRIVPAEQLAHVVTISARLTGFTAPTDRYG